MGSRSNSTTAIQISITFPLCQDLKKDATFVDSLVVPSVYGARVYIIFIGLKLTLNREYVKTRKGNVGPAKGDRMNPNTA